MTDQTFTREEIYQQISELAEQLVLSEPHSPGPYLVRLAVEWSHRNTAELYNELFVKRGGKLDVFEIMKLSGDNPDAPSKS